MAGGTPRAERYVGVFEDRDDAEIVELVRRVDQALDGLRIDAVLHGGRISTARRVAHLERNRLTVCRKARLEADRSLRAVTALTDFLFARPDELYRLATDRFRDRDRLGHFIGTETPAEAAAGERVVDVDLLGR